MLEINAGRNSSVRNQYRNQYLLPATLPGKGWTRWPSVVCRSPDGDLRLFTIFLFLPSQTCGSLLPAFSSRGQSCGGLTPAQETDGFSEFCASRGLPTSAWKSVTPTSSEILVRLLGIQWALCLSPARRRFALFYFIVFPCQREDRS